MEEESFVQASCLRTGSLAGVCFQALRQPLLGWCCLPEVPPLYLLKPAFLLTLGWGDSPATSVQQFLARRSPCWPSSDLEHAGCLVAPIGRTETWKQWRGVRGWAWGQRGQGL